MIYRKLDANQDYTFGQGKQDFVSGVEAVRQAVQTRLQLYKGTFWRDIDDGFPMFQVMGGSGAPENIALIESQLRQRILGTQGVTAILSYSSTFNGADREYGYTATLQTIYSNTVVSGVI